MRLFSLFFFIGIAIHGICCLSASQYRIFALGSTEKGIVVAEIHLRRTEGEEFKAAWFGATYLKVYDREMTELSSSISDTLALFADS